MDKKLPPRFVRSFKDADIRGIVGDELDDDLAYAVAQAFVAEFKYKTVLVGYDMRVSTPSLAEAFMRGVQDAGANVVNLGLVHSPMLYFASGDMQLPGVMITASHSPAFYNGLKLVEPDAIPLTKATGLSAILGRVEAGKMQKAKKRGDRKAKSVHKQYTNYILKGCRANDFKNMKIVADIGNGMASVMLPLIENKLPITFDSLFADMDGTFPNRGSDPTIRKHQKHLVKQLKSKKYDFGIAFDGDADRIAFLDEKGNYVNCAVIGAVIAKRLLAAEPKAGLVFTNLTSRIYEETIRAHDGKPLRARVGHAFLKRKMREHKAVFGCEHSGHFFFRDFFYTDSVVLTLRYVLEAYAEAKLEGQAFSEMVKQYQVYQQLEDEVTDVENKQAALLAVKKHIDKKYPKADLKKFDGWYLTTDNAWGAVKPSVTEHALKVMFEGHKKADAKKVQDDLVAFIKKNEK